MSKLNVKRDALVAAVKDVNNVLGLVPKIKTKDRDDKDIAGDLVKVAKGFDEESNKYVKEYAISREDELKDSTFKTLEAIGAIPAVAAKKAGKVDKSKGGSENATKKSGIKGASPRGSGVRTPKDFKGLKAALNGGNMTSMASQLDAMMLEPHSVSELQKAMNKVGKINVVSHIKYRYEVNGFDYKDKRKNSRDMDSIVQLVGITEGVSAGKRRTFPLEQAAAPVKAPKKDKASKKEEAPVKKGKKVSKKEEEAPKGKVKKSKKAK